MLIVTGVGLCIFVFATGYMHGDAGFYRFFAYLGLFMFSMLVLVLGSNFLMMFVGWEGVGLCSYLLIGYYLDRKEAGDAARKAFITKRIGDFGFTLGIFGIIATFGSAQFTDVMAQASSYPVELLGHWGLMSWIALGLFIGAIGKSAQIPLYVWLPDAMAGPTPVSALIHAATMVTAGLYMLTRTNVIFQFSGFWSKDEILWRTASTNFIPGGWILWLIATIAATCTAFYMTRLVAMTFWGKPRFTEKPAGGEADEAHAHAFDEGLKPHDARLESAGERPRHEPGEHVGPVHDTVDAQE